MANEEEEKKTEEAVGTATSAPEADADAPAGTAPKSAGKKKKKPSKAPIVFLVILFAVGLGILLYPIINNAWNTHIQNQRIARYNDTVETIAEDNSELYEAEWEKAFAYNDSLWPTPYPENFAFLNGNDPTPEYMDCLNINGDGIMGYVNIPKIDITVPIYHTTDEDDVLSKGSEHLEGTSLPIGGESTHCVISAHRGLPGSALFTDLDQMEEGDHFFLHTLGETLAYEVDTILTVEPNDVSALVIREGEDLCTLLTCTPYGVNTERLLVTGHRVDYEEETAEAEEHMGLTKGNNLYYLCVGLAAIAVIVLVIVLIRSYLKRKRNAEKAIQKGKDSAGNAETATKGNEKSPVSSKEDNLENGSDGPPGPDEQ